MSDEFLTDLSKYFYKRGGEKAKEGTGFSNPIAEYVVKHSLRENDILRKLREKTTETQEMFYMICAPEEGQLFSMLLKLMNAKKAIEIGVFTGYNTLNVALALPKDGKVIACDVSTDYVNIGKPFFEKAGVSDKIDLCIQPAVDTLDELLKTEAGTFDFIFIDADKTNYDIYYEKSLELLRSGGLIAVDNVLKAGTVLDPEKYGIAAKVVHQLNQKIHNDPRVDMSMLPISDGVTLCRKL